MKNPTPGEENTATEHPTREGFAADWLPEPRPAPEDPYWAAYADRVMGALDPVLTDQARAHVPPSWQAELGNRWRGAAILAAAAVAALLTVGDPPAPSPPSAPEDLALTLIAVDGDPVLLWERWGIPADPLLARLTLDGVRP